MVVHVMDRPAAGVGMKIAARSWGEYKYVFSHQPLLQEADSYE